MGRRKELLLTFIVFVVAQVSLFAQSDDWQRVIGNGFGDKNNVQVAEFHVFKGQVYAGTSRSLGPAQLWRTSDGQNWNRIAATSFSPSLQATEAGGIISFADSGGSSPQFLYAGTIAAQGSSGAIYRSTDGSSWTQINGSGSGWVATGNIGIGPNMVVKGGFLYAGTLSSTSAQIWRTPEGDPSRWEKVLDASTLDTNTNGITYLYVFNGVIYAATGCVEADNTVCIGGTAHLYSSATGDAGTWVKNRGVGDGFGDKGTIAIASMIDFNGFLYVSTHNNFRGGELWRSSDAVTWTKIPASAGGFGNPLNTELHNLRVAQGQLWVTTISTAPTLFPVFRSSDGVNFVQSNVSGFGDPNNTSSKPNYIGTTIGFGNFIYWGGANPVTGAQVWRTQPSFSSTPFTVANLGEISVASSGAATSVRTGYATIQPGTGSTAPSGVAIFGLRQNNVLVGETGVPATPTLTSGRIYAEIGGAVNTGLAIANPNSSTATISFYFTDTNGNQVGAGSMTLPGNQQSAQFLDQPPFNVYATATFQGTLSFTSTVPIAVVALRGFTNERADFLTSTLPVIDTTAPLNIGTAVIPHFADGGGWTTQILLVNPGDTPMTGKVQVLDPNGAAASVTIGGTTGSSFAYSVPQRTSQKFITAGTAPATASGSIRIVPDGGASPTPLVIFSYRQANITVSEAGVPVISGNAFRTYVEASGTTGQSSSIQTGVAIANISSVSASVTFDVTDLNGAPISGIAPVSISLPGSGQAAKFIGDLFPSLPSPFRGVVRITTTSSGVSVVGLRARINERGDFLITTTPPTNENRLPAATAVFFPQVADGAGYTTQFILFTGSAGQSSSGNLNFYAPSGQPLYLSLR